MVYIDEVYNYLRIFISCLFFFYIMISVVDLLYIKQILVVLFWLKVFYIINLFGFIEIDELL